MNNSVSEAFYDHGLHIFIRNLRAQNSGSEISVTVTIESGENSETKTLLLNMEQYCALNPRKGEISEELYEQLEAASSLCMAIRCGENLLSYGSNSVKMLSTKIMRHGFSREVSIAAAEHLCRSGLIDEQRDLRREVEKCLRKLWGEGRIRTQLWSRGYGQAALDALPQILEEVDFVSNCVTLIQKHYGGIPDDRDALKRISAGLYRYGYSMEQIRSAFRRMTER